MSIAVSSGTGTVPTPFKALKFAYIDDAERRMLEWLPIEQLYAKYPNRSGAHTPSFISRDGTEFVFGPAPKDFSLKGVYYAKQDNLHDTDGSWYVQNAPELLLYGALLEAEPYIKNDERIPVWRELFNEAVKTVQIEQRNGEYSKGLKAMRG